MCMFALIDGTHHTLKPENENYPVFELKEGQILEIWGVVIAAVTELHRP